jgi:hypothetical protein
MTSTLGLDAVRNVRTIVSHDHCADGLASALLAVDALPSAKVIFLDYRTEEHRSLEPTTGMMFCDFSPHPERASDFAEVGTIVLDHHRTAAAIVRLMGARGVFADEATEPGVSGAVLVYRNVWHPLKGGSPIEPFAERFAADAGIYDTWQTSDPRWRDAAVQARLLQLLPRDFWLEKGIDWLARRWDTQLRWLGEAVLAGDEERVRRVAESAYRFTTRKGTRVAVLAGLSGLSRASDVLASTTDVVAGFQYDAAHGRPQVRFELRSRGSFDCASFAQARGGGGHSRAAGFSRAVEPGDPQPYELLESLFEEA